MSLPFSAAEFFAVFSRYNIAIWPVQILFLGGAVLVLITTFAKRRDATRVAMIVLATLWLWMGIVYHGIYFRSINPAAATLFAAAFILEAGLLLAAARTAVHPEAGRNWADVLGAILIAYALLGYPLFGYFLGHRYPAVPTFGLPCPTTLFTTGVLLRTRPLRPALLIIPMLWSIIGFTAAVSLGVYQDVGLAVAFIAAAVAILTHVTQRRRLQSPVIAVKT